MKNYSRPYDAIRIPAVALALTGACVATGITGCKSAIDDVFRGVRSGADDVPVVSIPRQTPHSTFQMPNLPNDIPTQYFPTTTSQWAVP